MPLSEEQILQYCELVVEAGNETTRNAISGGLLAFCEHRAEWEKLRSRPELLPDAVEEILRWVTPITHFTRTATEDSELRGQKIRAGEQLALYYASANRDEEVFADPFAFRVDRSPNRHLAFGIGEHTCMGAHVARVELETMFRHMLDAPRVVRGRGARRAPELGDQRKHQAPAAPLPPEVARGTATSLSRAAARSRSAPDFTLALPVSESSSSRKSSTRRGTL